MEIPSSEKLKKPLIIALVILMIFILFYLALFIIGSTLLGDPLEEEERKEVYTQSEKLVNDIFTSDSKETYEQYLSSAVKEEDQDGIWWSNTVENIKKNDIISIAGYEEQGDISKKISSSSPEVTRYGIKLKLELDTAEGKEKTTAEIEWIREEAHLKLYLLEMPFRFPPVVEPVNTVYGID